MDLKPTKQQIEVQQQKINLKNQNISENNHLQTQNQEHSQIVQASVENNNCKINNQKQNTNQNQVNQLNINQFQEPHNSNELKFLKNQNQVIFVKNLEAENKINQTQDDKSNNTDLQNQIPNDPNNSNNSNKKNTGILGQIKDAFNKKVQQIQGQEGINVVKEKYQYFKNVQFQKVQFLQKIENEVKSQFGKLSQQQQKYLVNQKEALNRWGKQKMIVIIIKFLEKSQPIVYEFLTDDPYMPKSVKEFIKDILEEFWPSIQQKILDEFQENLNLKINNKNEKDEQNQFQVTCCLKRLTALYLYQKNPYNKSYWYQIKQIPYWILTILELIPYYSIQSFIHIFIFLIIDKSDEWQLIRYIINYKIKQFFSYGIIYGFIGYIMYFNCYTFQDKSSHTDKIQCAESGPGYELSLLVDSIGFLLQIFLVWQCYFWLKCSKKLQKEQQIKNKVKSKSSCFCCTVTKRNGGRLKVFLFIDLFFFALCIVPVILILTTDKYNQDFQLRSTIFLMKIAYGLFSGIFLIFIFDPLTELVTFSQRTGYDKFGNVRQYRVKKRKKQAQKQIQEQNQNLTSKKNNIVDKNPIKINQNKYQTDNENQIENKQSTYDCDEESQFLDQKLFEDIL